METLDYRLTDEQEKLFLANKGLVYFTLKRFNTSFVRNDNDDIYNEGLLGLVRACQTYDPSCGVQFSTYAVKCIYLRIYIAIRKLTRQQSRLVSLDAPTVSSIQADGVNNEIPRSEIFRYLTQNEDDFAKRVDNINMLNRIHHLKDRDKKIVSMLIEGYTLDDIGKELGIKKQFVSITLQRIRAFLTAPVDELKEKMRKNSVYKSVPEY